MHEGFLVSFEIGGEKVEVPNTAGVKQGDNMAPVLFIFVMQACLETLSDSWPAGKLEFRTNTRTTGARGGKVSGTDWTNRVSSLSRSGALSTPTTRGLCTAHERTW
jgi:hypothetical protein